MRAYRRLCVHLSKRERKELRQLLRKGIQPVCTVLRALTLQLDAGQAACEVATIFISAPRRFVRLAGAMNREGSSGRMMACIGWAPGSAELA